MRTDQNVKESSKQRLVHWLTVQDDEMTQIFGFLELYHVLVLPVLDQVYVWVILAILSIKWNLVVRGSWSSFFMYLLQYCSTDLLYMCGCAVNKTPGDQADHGHKKGHAPRAIQGHSPTGISRPRTEVLRTRANFSAANTLLRGRASRGHPNLYIRIR